MKALWFVPPVADPRRYIVLQYGQYYNLGYHTGYDVVSQTGSCAGWPVGAIAWGVVTYAQRVTVPGFTVWGNLVVIRHELPDGTVFYSRSAHMDNLQVEPGQRVYPGQMIGRIGNAFGVYGYHLHLDIAKTTVLAITPWDWPGQDLKRVYDNYVDPYTFIRSHKMVADFTALRLAMGNLGAAVVDVNAIIDNMDANGTEPPPPAYLVMYISSTSGANVRSSCSTVSTANILGGLAYRTEVHVKLAATAGWYELIEPIGKLPAGSFISGTVLTDTYPN